ncbi:MAG TPA: RNA polymerase sigma factor [Alphaproteobacteria bacterium]|nr:RNA polymerase sigma factor [Alphaproteobacteria bacterium]
MRGGETGWFHGFFLKHQRSLRRYLTGLVASPDMAEDLAQEAFARVFAIDNGGLRSPQSFLYRTAHNLALDHIRHQRVAATEPLLDELGERIAQDGPSAEAGLAAKEELALVYRAINELPPKCRRVFLLLRFEGMSFKEVAAEMRLSQTMVRKYAFRALEYCQMRVRCESDGLERQYSLGRSSGRR